MQKTYELTCDKAYIKKHAIRAKKARVIEKMEQRFDEYYDLLHNTMELSSCCAMIENTHSLKQPELDQSDHLAVCYISLGKPLQDLIDTHVAEGKIFEGFFLNEIANEMIMDLSSDMFKKIKADMDKMGLRMTKRFSPGECTMAMTYQTVLKDIIETESPFQVHLTDNLLMIPSKSMMYCYGADENNQENAVDVSCHDCSNTKCYYNRNKA